MIYGEDQPAILSSSKQGNPVSMHMYRLTYAVVWMYILFSSPQSSSASESIQFTLSSHDRSCGGRMVALLQCQSDIQSCCFGYLHIRVVQVSKVKSTESTPMPVEAISTHHHAHITLCTCANLRSWWSSRPSACAGVVLWYTALNDTQVLRHACLYRNAPVGGGVH